MNLVVFLQIMFAIGVLGLLLVALLSWRNSHHSTVE